MTSLLRRTSATLPVLATALAALLLGAWLNNLGLAAVGSALLIAVALDATFVAGQPLRLTIEVPRASVAEGERIPVSLQAKGNRRARFVRIQLDPTYRVVDGSNIATLRGSGKFQLFDVEATARGPRTIGPAQWRTWSPLHLWLREDEQGEPHDVHVMPRAEVLDDLAWTSRVLKPMQGQFTANRPGQGFDFFNLRGYEASDTMRDVNWKATARRDDLIVNQRQRETQTEACILLDATVFSGAGPAGATPLDRACRVVRSLMEEMIGNRDIVRFVHYGKQATQFRPGADDALHALGLLLGALKSTGEGTLSEAWRTVRPTMSSTGPVFVISSFEGDPDAPGAVAEIVAAGHAVTCISARPRGPTWEGNEKRQELRSLTLRSIQALGAVVVDWSDDEPLRAEAAQVQVGP